MIVNSNAIITKMITVIINAIANLIITVITNMIINVITSLMTLWSKLSDLLIITCENIVLEASF